MCKLLAISMLVLILSPVRTQGFEDRWEHTSIDSEEEVNCGVIEAIMQDYGGLIVWRNPRTLATIATLGELLTERFRACFKGRDVQAGLKRLDNPRGTSYSKELDVNVTCGIHDEVISKYGDTAMYRSVQAADSFVISFRLPLDYWWTDFFGKGCFPGAGWLVTSYVESESD